MVLLLYEFRYRHARTGKWVKARYRAALHQIAEVHEQFELIGEPERREPAAGSFDPYRSAQTQRCTPAAAHDAAGAPPPAIPVAPGRRS